jgi:alpha-L-fucosidase 2
VRLIPPPFTGRPEKFVAIDHGHGSLGDLGYPAPAETKGETWRAYSQQGWGDFRFAVYAAWKRDEAGWLLAWSIASDRRGAEPLGTAREQVRRSLAAGWDRLLASHRTWWNTYWAQSSVTLPNPVLERLWYLEQYKFGAASRRGAPPISLQAIWTADNGQIPPWKGDYHHDLNTQLSYWPCYSGNHVQDGLAYLDWLWDTRPAAFRWTKQFFRMPGLNVPMTADLDGRQIGGWRQYTHSATTAAWLAHHFWLHWRYSGDRAFLRDRAYPYLRDAATFLEAYTAARDTSGKRTHPLSSSPEINDNRPEAWFSTVTNYDLALERWLMGAASELAAELNLRNEAERWRRVLSELPQLATGSEGQLLVARNYPLAASHRHFSHLMAIHPLGLIDWSDGPEARRTIRASVADLERLGTSLWTGYSFAWLASLHARARDGDKAEQALQIFATAFTSRNSFHVNGDQSGKGYSNFRYRPFTLEGNFAAAQGVQEMLLQGQRGRIVVFPAVPDSWKEVSFEKLRAEGAFLVSAQRRNGSPVRVEIFAERGGPVTVISPFTGTEIGLTLKTGERRVLTE